MVRALFRCARRHSPSVIFVDELDSLLSRRSNNEHESSRRMKTEFLVQLDGLTESNEGSTTQILLVGATNLPSELDDAVLRRLTKRI